VGAEYDLLLYAAQKLNAAGVKYFVSGSVAAMHYGESRLTIDIDVVVHLRFGDVSSILDAFSEPDFFVQKESVIRALREDGQFNVIQPSTGMKIDFMCAEVSAYNDSRFARVQSMEEHGTTVWFSAPEDVILKKLEYFKEGASDKHLRDIASMIKVSGATFDRDYLERWARSLGVEEEWRVVKNRAGW